MAQGKVTIITQSEYNSLFDTIHELDRRVRQLESDIYDMRRDNTELRRRVSDLESTKRMPRMPPF